MAVQSFEPLPLVARSDALVDDVDWRDTGCDVSPSCLACPLPVCRYDSQALVDHLARQKARMDHQRASARGLLREGVTVSDIARILGVSRRTVFRYLEHDR